MEMRIGDVWYFAYGSNLWIDQKECRTGPIRTGDDEPQIARLPGYRLAFNKPGMRNQVYANIVEAPGEEVIGVIYRCDPEAMSEMDDYEQGYNRESIVVMTESQEEVEAVTYIAERPIQEGRPSKEYLDRIVKGARQHGLPEEYIEKIKLLATPCEEGA